MGEGAAQAARRRDTALGRAGPTPLWSEHSRPRSSPNSTRRRGSPISAGWRCTGSIAPRTRTRSRICSGSASTQWRGAGGEEGRRRLTDLPNVSLVIAIVVHGRACRQCSRPYTFLRSSSAARVGNANPRAYRVILPIVCGRTRQALDTCPVLSAALTEQSGNVERHRRIDGPGMLRAVRSRRRRGLEPTAREYSCGDEASSYGAEGTGPWGSWARDSCEDVSYPASVERKRLANLPRIRAIWLIGIEPSLHATA